MSDNSAAVGSPQPTGARPLPDQLLTCGVGKAFRQKIKVYLSVRRNRSKTMAAIVVSGKLGIFALPLKCNRQSVAGFVYTQPDGPVHVLIIEKPTSMNIRFPQHRQGKNISFPLYYLDEDEATLVHKAIGRPIREAFDKLRLHDSVSEDLLYWLSGALIKGNKMEPKYSILSSSRIGLTGFTTVVLKHLEVFCMENAKVVGYKPKSVLINGQDATVFCPGKDEEKTLYFGRCYFSSATEDSPSQYANQQHPIIAVTYPEPNRNTEAYVWNDTAEEEGAFADDIFAANNTTVTTSPRVAVAPSELQAHLRATAPQRQAELPTSRSPTATRTYTSSSVPSGSQKKRRLDWQGTKGNTSRRRKELENTRNRTAGFLLITKGYVRNTLGIDLPVLSNRNCVGQACAIATGLDLRVFEKIMPMDGSDPCFGDAFDVMEERGWKAIKLSSGRNKNGVSGNQIESLLRQTSGVYILVINVTWRLKVSSNYEFELDRWGDVIYAKKEEKARLVVDRHCLVLRAKERLLLDGLPYKKQVLVKAEDDLEFKKGGKRAKERGKSILLAKIPEAHSIQLIHSFEIIKNEDTK